LLKSVYQNVEDIDLFAGMTMENICANGGLIGCTFQCLIGDVFARVKFGDRFYYEFSGQTGSFTERKTIDAMFKMSNEFILIFLEHILTSNEHFFVNSKKIHSIV
jgi:hypothetical protein